MSLKTIGWLCIAWAFFLGVVGFAWLNLPSGLMIVGTVLYVISEVRS